MLVCLLITVVLGLGGEPTLAGQIVYREGETRIRSATDETLRSLQYALAGHLYPRDIGNDSDTKIIQMTVTGYDHHSTDNVVHFSPPRSVKVLYHDSCFCVSYAGTAVSSWTLFPVSAAVSFSICANDCNVTIDVPSSQEEKIAIALEATLSLKNVNVNGWFAGLIGFNSKVADWFKLSSPSMLDTVRTLWESAVAQRYHYAHNRIAIELFYPAWNITAAFPRASSHVSAEGYLEVLYGRGPAALVSPVTAAKTFWYSFPHEMFTALYQQTMMQLSGKVLNIFADDVPADSPVRLDTQTFGQAIPDLIMLPEKKNLSVIKICAGQQGEIGLRTEGTAIWVTNLGFGIEVYDWDNAKMLSGTFKLSLLSHMVFECGRNSSRLLPMIVRAKVEVTELTSPTHEHVLKSGMAQIVSGMLDGFLLRRYGNLTLGGGVYFSGLGESLDPSRCRVETGADSVDVMAN